MFGKVKDNIKLICLFVMFIVLILFSGESMAMKCSDGSDSIQCCRIMSTDTGDRAGSLTAAVNAFNNGDAYGACQNEIIFDVETLNIAQPKEFKFSSQRKLDIIAYQSNDDDAPNTTIKNATDDNNSKFAFVIKGMIQQVNFKNHFVYKSNGRSAGFLKCENNTDVNIEKLTADANIVEELLDFSGCGNVVIEELYLNTTFDGNTEGNDPKAFISAHGGGTSVTINNFHIDSISYGDLINVSGISNLTVKNLTFGDNAVLAEGWIAHVTNVTNIGAFKVDGDNIANGLYLENVRGGSGIDLRLGGNADGDTFEPTEPWKTVGNALQMVGSTSYVQGTVVSAEYFNYGVILKDAANNNTFDSLITLRNKTYGVSVEANADNNTFHGITSSQNGVCGLFMGGTGRNIFAPELETVPTSYKFGSNGPAGSPCTITTDAAMTIDGDAIQIYPTAYEDMTGVHAVINVNRNAMINDYYIDLHNNRFNGDDSLLLDNVLINDLPGRYELGEMNNTFTVVFKTDAHAVIGVWTGTYTLEGNYNDSNGAVSDPHCFKSPYPDAEGEYTYYRIDDPNNSPDTDGDGLLDMMEDVNMNCRTDEGETNVYDADSDGDGVYDLTEVTCFEGLMDPWSRDSDGDGKLDGEEVRDDVLGDSSQGCLINKTDKVNGGYESHPGQTDSDSDGMNDLAEANLGTDPNDPDTDDDGTIDGLDDCPFVDGRCYRQSCNEEGGPNLTNDQDDDGILDYLEDENGNCEFDAHETRVDLADTDGDGIPDGLEDWNFNGKVDEGESDPRKADSDGDCITDDLEDKNGDGRCQMEAFETCAFMKDSDGDGVNDGLVTAENANVTNPFLVAEDWNCNGEQDPGETKPWLADTDGDGIDDLNDVAPFNRNPDAKARFCEEGGSFINGYSDYDADGDGATDEQELFAGGDCTDDAISLESDPLVFDTDGDGLSDGQELICFQTNPRDPDTDADGRTDYEELQNSLNNCTVMFARGDSDATDFNKSGACGFNIHAKNDATSAVTLTIISLALALLVALRRKKANV